MFGTGEQRVETVNVGRPQPNPHKENLSTGIGKQPVAGRIEVRAPGAKHGGLGSGLVGDFIGDKANHGGDDQAVYSFAREDLDSWQQRLGRELPNGFFGENLTTVGIDVNQARIGERWLIGPNPGSPNPGSPDDDQVELEVTCPRIPCSTFRGRVGEKGWLRTFTLVARPGAYLKVIKPGRIGAGDSIAISRVPDHDVTVSLVFRATTTERELLPELLAAGDDLSAELRQVVADRGGWDLI
ncbi:MOSC domain-containing protein [Microlunatus elymi]|uniref:MOSC domain-containing protein n=1 Tax=Microlunatus elymi TaxID=2596828 RepID=A0A516PWG3_9ACTN|nr:MOSC domain-containing protein [Microlunatus elymi]QDP95499.1 MOSC domain-containing protein [Microlunatus elymi]